MVKLDSTPDNSACVCVDGSYVVYAILHGAVKDWKDESRDAENLPDMKAEPNASPIDVLVYESFRDVLRKKVGDTMYKVRNVIRDNILGGVSVYDPLDVFFVLDSHTGNWRYEYLKSYKANRRTQKHPFEVRRVFDYIVNTLIPNCNLLDDLGWKRIEVHGVEGDDITATIMRNTTASVKGIVSSDHDYLQLGPSVKIFDLRGENHEILPDEYNGKRLTHGQAIKMKVLIGDKSDNIPNVWPGIGPKKALKKYIVDVDRSVLKDALENDPIAKKRFELNAKLIMFSEIPDYVVESVKDEIHKVSPSFKMTD